MNKIVNIKGKSFRKGFVSGFTSVSRVNTVPAHTFVARDGGSVEKAWRDVGKIIITSSETEFRKMIGEG